MEVFGEIDLFQLCLAATHRSLAYECIWRSFTGVAGWWWLTDHSPQKNKAVHWPTFGYKTVPLSYSFRQSKWAPRSLFCSFYEKPRKIFLKLVCRNGSELGRKKTHFRQIIRVQPELSFNQQFLIWGHVYWVVYGVIWSYSVLITDLCFTPNLFWSMPRRLCGTSRY